MRFQLCFPAKFLLEAAIILSSEIDIVKLIVRLGNKEHQFLAGELRPCAGGIGTDLKPSQDIVVVTLVLIGIDDIVYPIAEQVIRRRVRMNRSPDSLKEGAVG